MFNEHRKLGLSALSLATFVAVGCTFTGCTLEVPVVDEFLADRCVWSGAAAGPETLNLAVVLPLTVGGEVDLDADANARAVQLAVDDVNTRQGITGRKFRLATCDKRGDWTSGGTAQAAHIARWLHEQKVSAVISGGSGDTIAIHAETKGLGTLVVAQSATSADITFLNDDGLVWRTAPSDLYQGVVMARVLRQEGATQVAVIHEGGSYGESLAKIIKDQADATMAVKTWPLSAGAANIANLLTLVAGQKPDFVVLIAGAEDAVKVVNAKDPALPPAKLLLADALHSHDFTKHADMVGKLTGALGTLPGDPNGPVFETLSQHFQLMMGIDPRQRSYTAHSYDAAMAVILAHAWALREDGKAAVTGVKLAEGMKQLSAPGGPKHTLEPTSIIAAVTDLLAGKAIDIEGASGALDFEESTGEPKSAVEVWSVKADGDFETLRWIHATQTDGKWSYTETKP